MRSRQDNTLNTILARLLGAVVLMTLAAACSGADELDPPTAGDPPTATDGPEASVPDEGVPEESVPDESVPDEPAPDETTPSTPDDEPETTAPSDDETPSDETADDATTDDNEVDPLLVALAVAGFVGLVAIAAVWMLRRNDPDESVGRRDQHDWPDDQMSI